ncbi:MAG TPA: hypothetical protein VMU28_10930 [Terriglobales bacterium]|nr:hypothetical protein [Terriglobales bacterium]
MKTPTKTLLVFCCTLVLSAMMAGQQRDPLNDTESDQLREYAQEPDKRLKLMIKFASERLDTVEEALKEPNPKGRGQRVHDSLQDFRELVDELDDNIDDFVQKQQDVRKPLNEVITAEEGYDKRLKAIKERAQDPKLATEFGQYSFVLQDAEEAVNLSLEDAKKTLAEQNAAMAEEKKKK